jgi:hypothetical protein
MSDELVTAINRLASQTGKMEGKFECLEKYIKGRTDTCQRNYESLSTDMGKISGRLNGIDIENEVKGKFRKILYNRITLLCTIIGLAIAFLGLERSNVKKTETKLTKISKEIRQMKITNANKVKETHGKVSGKIR